MSSVEPASHVIRRPDGKVQVAPAWNYNLIEEAVEYSATGSVELAPIDNLVQHDALRRYVHFSDTSAFAILLEGDCDTERVNEFETGSVRV